MKSFMGLVGGAVAASLWYQRPPVAHCAAEGTPHPAGHAPTTKAKATPISPAEFRPFPLINVYDESSDCKVLRFALPEGDMTLNLEVSSCILLRFVDKDGKEIVRPYTPITATDQQGYFEILVKRYPNAKMGTHLHTMKKNQTIDIKGPFEKIKVGTNQWKRIGLIAGGTGITPCYQVIRKVLNDPKDKTEVNLICAFRRKEDVLLGNEINELMDRHPRFSPYFVLSNPPPSWMGGVGHVNREMIKAFLPPPSGTGDSIIMVSGPPAMMQTVSGDKDFSKSPPSQGELSGILKEMGYTSKQVFKF